MKNLLLIIIMVIIFLKKRIKWIKKRENIITGEVEDWSVATQPDINELYEARKFREVDRVERATELQFDKLETQKYPEIGSANAFSQGEKLAHLSSSTRNPKIQSAIDRLHKKHDLVASEFSQIDTRMMDDIFNSDLADQRVRTDKKAFESLILGDSVEANSTSTDLRCVGVHRRRNSRVRWCMVNGKGLYSTPCALPICPGCSAQSHGRSAQSGSAR